MLEPTNERETAVVSVADPGRGVLTAGVPPARISMGVRIAILIVMIVPLLAVLAAPIVVWGWGFRWTDLGLLVSLYVLTALGVTVGYHRLFVHRSLSRQPAW